MARRIIQASELASYDFCRRAWGYTLAGMVADSARLEAGRRWHEVHGRRVNRAAWLRLAGWVLLLLALMLAISSWLGPLIS
ncbi:MAG TPA: hypothetical protein VGA52_04810 [Anaerolineales bacterium]|jgi:hypothetical protein